MLVLHEASQSTKVNHNSLRNNSHLPYTIGLGTQIAIQNLVYIVWCLLSDLLYLHVDILTKKMILLCIHN